MIKLYGNQKIYNLLTNASTNNSIASTYLFYGPKGVGKEAVAIKFASFVNNLDESKWLNSTNITYLHKTPTNKSTKKAENFYDNFSDDVVESIKDELNKKQANPYYNIEIANASQIRIDTIRILRKKLSTSSSSGRRFVIVSDADTMNPAAANSFLKTLEEPNPNTTIILIADNINSMLPTILSRSQKMKFSPLTNDELNEYLADNYPELTSEKRRIITSFSQGSISNAIDFIDQDISLLVEATINLLRASLQKSGYRILLSERVGELTKLRDKNLIVTALKLLQRWLQDALHLSNGEDKLIVNISTIDSIRKFANYYDKANYFKAFDYIEQAIVKVNRNVSSDLLLIDLFLKLRNEFLGSKL